MRRQRHMRDTNGGIQLSTKEVYLQIDQKLGSLQADLGKVVSDMAMLNMRTKLLEETAQAHQKQDTAEFDQLSSRLTILERDAAKQEALLSNTRRIEDMEDLRKQDALNRKIEIWAIVVANVVAAVGFVLPFLLHK